MATRILLVLALLLAAGLGAYLLLGPDRRAPASAALDRNLAAPADAPATPDARLLGVPAPEAPDPFVAADVTTTLGAFRLQPPNVPAGAVARLGAIVDADPGLLEHLIDVAIGLEPLRDGLLPADYPYGGPHQITAMWALRALGPRAAKAIAARLEKEDAPTFRDRLLDRLRDLDADAAPATAALIACVRDDTLPDDTRDSAIWILGRIGAPARDVLPDLFAILQDPEGPLFASALTSLYPVGGNQPRVMDTFRGLLASDDSWLLRDVLGVVFEQMKEDAEALRTSLESLLEFDQDDVRLGALQALQPTGVKDARVIRLVGFLVEDGDADQERAAQTLLRASGEAGLARLLDLAQHTEDLGVALGCCRTLAEAGVPLASHPGILQRLLREAEGPVLSGFVSLLASLSPPPRAQDLLPLVRAAVGDTQSPTRYDVLWVLPTLRGDETTVLALLEGLLDDEALGPTAVGALGRMTHAADRAVPLLLTRLDAAPGGVIDALRRLAAVNPGARKALRTIAETHASEAVRRYATTALEKVGNDG